MAKKDYDALAKFILENVGGKDNVISLTHCITRLRFKLKDEGKANTAALKNHEHIVDVIQKGGQYQVVIGNDVEDAYDAVMKLGGFSGAATQDAGEDDAGKSLFDKAVDLISGIFTPVIPLLAACGIIKGLVAFAAAMGWLTQDSGTYQIIYAAGDCFYYFFPIFLGYTAGLNRFTGMAVGAALVYPTLATLQSGEAIFTLFEGTPIATNVTTTFLGIPVLLVTYTSSVVPVIASCYVGSKLEKLFKRIIPDVVKMFLVPACTILITFVLTLLVVGPIMTWASQLIATGVMAVRNVSPVLTGAIVGGLWQVLVVFGLHHAFTPIRLNSLLTLGYENTICCMQCVPFTTMAVVFAVYFRTKDKKLKARALPAAISSFFGVSEPSIYGVTLPLKRPFAITLCSAAVGGALMGLFNVTAYANAGLGLFALPAYINPASNGLDMQFWGLIIALVVAMGLGFTLTFLFGVPQAYITGTAADATPEELAGEDDAIVKQETFTAPVAGEVVDLADVSDEVFASGTLGKGVAVKPSDGNVYAPCDGVVSALFPTGHAVGITAAQSGAELLIHIGVDTVQLDGKGFTKHVAAGDTVKRGQLLISFDRDLITSEGYDDTVIFIVSNTASFQDVVRAHDATAATDRELLAVAV